MLNKHVPLKSKVTRENNKPFETKILRKAIMRRIVLKKIDIFPIDIFIEDYFKNIIVVSPVISILCIIIVGRLNDMLLWVRCLWNIINFISCVKGKALGVKPFIVMF